MKNKLYVFQNFFNSKKVLTKSKNFNAECHYDTSVTTMSNSFLVNFSTTPLLVGDTNKVGLIVILFQNFDFINI